MTPGALLLVASMAVAAGVIGCFAVMRRMAITADPLSHVALPGIGIALALHINPLVGAGAMLLFAAVVVWAVEQRSRATTEIAIGVVFSSAFAIGGMITSGEGLIDSLFGGGGTPTVYELVGGLVTASVIVGFILARRNQLVVMLVSPDVALTAGINVRRVNLLFLLAFALTLGLGLRYLGVLLMAALIITPPATAMRLATSLTGMLVIAVVLAVSCAVLGEWIAPGLASEHRTGHCRDRCGWGSREWRRRHIIFVCRIEHNGRGAPAQLTPEGPTCLPPHEAWKRSCQGVRRP